MGVGCNDGEDSRHKHSTEGVTVFTFCLFTYKCVVKFLSYCLRWKLNVNPEKAKDCGFRSKTTLKISTFAQK